MPPTAYFIYIYIYIYSFPGSLAGKESACNAGYPSSIPGSGRSPGEGIAQCSWASLVAQMVKNPPAMQETWVQSMDWEGPLKGETATHSRILAWRIPWTEEPGGLQSMGLLRLRHDWATHTFPFGWRKSGENRNSKLVSMVKSLGVMPMVKALWRRVSSVELVMLWSVFQEGK